MTCNMDCQKRTGVQVYKIAHKLHLLNDKNWGEDNMSFMQLLLI